LPFASLFEDENFKRALQLCVHLMNTSDIDNHSKIDPDYAKNRIKLFANKY